MTNSVESFLTTTEEQEIITAIRKAEDKTSGEIRVHIENSADGDIDSRALEVFSILKMQNTKLQNGVLIYVAVADRNFAIYGDKGIDAVVPNDFWDATMQSIQSQFKKGNFKDGLVDGILKAGEQLHAHFPWQDSDRDELPNHISKG